MKKFIAGILIGITLTCGITVFAYGTGAIFINGVKLDMRDTNRCDGRTDIQLEVISKNGRTYLPLRKIAEALGAKVEWEAKTGNIYITK